MSAKCSMLLAIGLAVSGLPSESCRAGEALASAGGKVTLDGQPLAKGKIVFHFGDGQFIGTYVKDGMYKLARLPVGTHKVTIEALLNGKNVLPARYASENTSALRVEVRKGKNTFDLDLTTR
jgi:hypothetical protein